VAPLLDGEVATASTPTAELMEEDEDASAVDLTDTSTTAATAPVTTTPVLLDLITNPDHVITRGRHDATTVCAALLHCRETNMLIVCGDKFIECWECAGDFHPNCGEEFTTQEGRFLGATEDFRCLSCAATAKTAAEATAKAKTAAECAENLNKENIHPV
jgi:hypothetical protein